VISICLLAPHGFQPERALRGVIVANTLISSKPLDLKSILVAIDFTEASDRALQHGIAIASHYRATLYVVYVVSSPGLTINGPEAVELAAIASERDLNQLVKAMTASAKMIGVEVCPIVLKGNVDKEVEIFARAHHVDLIVVSTHGRCGMAMLFGSIAQQISKYCCCPVLTVGPHSSVPRLDDQADTGRPLLLATAINKGSAKAAPYAISQKCAVTHLVEGCNPADGILRAAKRLHADSIIMGAHRDSVSDLSTRLSATITNQVNRGAMCPVLTVRG
jgi:nucleotide-binding universal stress UspA family protein